MHNDQTPAPPNFRRCTGIRERPDDTEGAGFSLSVIGDVFHFWLNGGSADVTRRAYEKCSGAAVLMSESGGEPFTEIDAIAELATWVVTRPRWQSDALRRLITKDQLDRSDIEQLTEICLNPHCPSQPLTNEHAGSASSPGDPISLLKIEKLTGVNALASNQSLTFTSTGLTIIYGDNGSGKSGYVRVLKHACRTRDRDTAILGDIGDPTNIPQAASITFQRGASPEDFAWAPDKDGHPELTSVSIFDSRSANIHVEKTNAVAYIPRPMKLLESLASVCDDVKDKLDAQLVALAGQTPVAIKSPTLKRDTAAGAYLHALSAKSSLPQLELLCTLTPENEQRLATIEADLAQDPKRVATRIVNQKTRLFEEIGKLQRLDTATGAEAFATRDTAQALVNAKSETARLASEALFAASPLPSIGQKTWLALWEAARKYSDEVAYKSQLYPSAQSGDLCVLCQQPLSEETITRRHTLEDFVKGTTRAEEEAARKAHQTLLTNAKAQTIPMKHVRLLRILIGSEIGEESLSTTVSDAVVKACWRLRALLRGTPAPKDAAEIPFAELSALVTTLTLRHNQLSADQASPEHIALLKEYSELKDRKALGPLKDDVRAEIARLKNTETIKKALKDTGKKTITTKNKEISDKLVTNALRGRFAREIEKLKLSRMPVELRKTKDQNAVSYFQVCLVENPSRPVGEIFSEGEHRCVALAVFLAELVTAKRYSGIVFDDPMSSLDHIHRRAVAARLVEEAAHRQVIVFTHDLTFLFELRREAEAKNAAVHYQTIQRRNSKPGHVEAELPTKAKSARELAHSLRGELKSIKTQFDTMPEAKRTLFCKGFIELLREAWDQGIADFIFPVLARFENSIKGTSLFKLAVLTDEDVKTVTGARGRLSEDLHVSSETLNPETVKHDDLHKEIGKLEAWLDDIAKRQKEAKAPLTSYA